ncbi:MAG: phosphate ABC transporter substrate-binding protein PstS [Aquihabitans sp.]
MQGPRRVAGVAEVFLSPPRVRIVGVALALAFVAVGCGDSGTPEPLAVPHGPQTTAIASTSGNIKGSGASFPDAFYQEAVAGLMPVAPDLQVTYEAVGSAAGREAFAQGLADFAGTDSLVGEDDGIAPGSFTYIPATAASVAVVYNLPDVPGLRLDPDALASVLQRDIVRWNDPVLADLNPDVTLPDLAITVARRSDGAGTTKNFTRYMASAAPDAWKLGSDDTVEWPSATQGGQQNSGVAQIVTATPGAIGYVDYGNAMEIGLQVTAIRNRSGNFVAPSVEATKAAVAGSPLNDELVYNPLDGPGLDAYPITAPTYLLVRTHYGDAQTGQAVVAFVKWLITDGADTFAADLGYAPVPEAFRVRAFEALDQVEVG